MRQESGVIPDDFSSVEANRPTKWRLIGAVASGLFSGYLMSEAFWRGATYVFDNENPEETWGPYLFFWGEHWVLRGIASIVATAWGAFLAGVVAREKGKVAAIIAVLPASLLWGAAGVMGITGKPIDGHSASLSSYLLGIVLCLAIPFVALKAGSKGSNIGQELGPHFDSRPRTLLGIKWFHYLWTPFALNVIAIETAWAFLYAATLYGRFSLVAWILQGAILATLSLTLSGLLRAYLILSGLEPATNHRGLTVIKFGCGWPLLAAILQEGIYGIHYGLAKLFH